MDVEQQFQSAARLHQSGDLSGAENILAELAATVPNHPDILHFLGLVRLQAGKPEAAADTLGQLTELRPDWAEGFDMFGCALRQSGRVDAAMRQFRKAIKLNPEFAQAYYNMGNAYRDNRQFDEAARHYNKTILIKPDHMDARFNLGQSLFNLGKLIEAVAAFKSVTDHNPADSEAGLALARTLVMLNNLSAAQTALENTVAAAPDAIQSWELLADISLRLNAYERAIACYDRLLASNSVSPVYLRGKAMAQRGAGDPEGAVDSCRNALTLSPDDPETQFSLTMLLERLNQLEEAREITDRGLEGAPGHPGLSLVAARLDRREGDLERGIARLKALSPESLEASPAHAEIHFELGTLYERVGRPGDAIENFALGNRHLINDATMLTTLKERSTAYLERIHAAYEDVPLESQSEFSAAATGSPPVFLVGFPRSGTTLLDQVLDAHPGIQVLEEQPTISEVRDHLVRRGDSFPANVFTLPEAVFESLRATYFEAVEKCIVRDQSTLLVDKLPLNILDVGMIHRLFPSAKFILALRHPCDVCLSCFMQPFELNEAMAHFTNLEDTVAFYDQVMGLWQKQREALNLSVHEVRYENLVAGLEPVARDLLEFLELPWDDAVLDPTSHARQQKFIGTSSFEIINSPTVDRWRKYEIHMTPYLKRLKPHIEALGYSDKGAPYG